MGAQTAVTLSALRADSSVLTARHPDHMFRPAPDRLTRWQALGVDTALFHSGLYAARCRYAELGLSQMLPPERVLVGAESVRSGAFGGFHHPDQGYRHLQMLSVVTMYGPMERDNPERPEMALLDLLRAYAHDCLHYGSRRRYVDVGGRPTRTQYGINFRRPTGQSYSAADPQGTPHTRNLGVVMEGACDREARRITRDVAARAGMREPADVLGRLAFRDTTGTLTEEDVRGDLGSGHTSEAAQYAGALQRYEAGVNRRYAAFLAEFAPCEEEDLHDLLLTAVINGDTRGLSAWLDARHGPNTFAGAFLTGAYFTPTLDLGA
ncbi:hypothetical protein [Streptomyces lydicus]|uniref:hypothetical protein n=1 Tax=Streptomyces lydicus TaxID=47763 RepID=UPI001F513B31|nr:hypothetical protein [Streptomyces lydicus]